MRLAEVMKSNGLMDHCIRVTDVPEREPWLTELCRGRTVLHVGCCDVPIFDPNNNLHISLNRCAARLDGLDISEEGLRELRRHVAGKYFTSPTQVTESYDLVLIPEVLEHTPNPQGFLDGVFRIRARRYLVTAPNIEWFGQTRRDGEYFHEQVHSDHRAWYSPYTLLNTLRPYITEDEDDIEVFLIQRVGSVGVSIGKPGPGGAESSRSLPRGDVAPPRDEAAPPRNEAEEDPLSCALALRNAGQTAEALALLARTRASDPRTELYYLESELLLELGRHLDTLRAGVAFLRDHPNDARCLRFCAAASEALGDPRQAQQLLARANQCDAKRQPAQLQPPRTHTKKRHRSR